MMRRRSLAVSALSALLALGLSGCVAIPFLPGGGGGTATSQSADDTAADVAAIDDTTWTGTDSDGDVWQITFESGGGIAFSYNENSFDDDSDTWTLSGDELTITIAFSDGTATMTGPYVDAATPIALTGTDGAATWTLELQPS